MVIDPTIILSCVPNGERNRRPTKDQLSVDCPSYVLENSTKNFCISKKWWDLWTINSDQESDPTSNQLSNHFKVLYDNKFIDHPTLKMAYNHLRIFLIYHVFKNGTKLFPYSDLYEKKYVSYHIKEVSDTKHNNIGVKRKRIRSKEKYIMEVQNS